MLAKPESAGFVIADISGYAQFLAPVELDHAQEIITDLMDTVVRSLRPPPLSLAFSPHHPTPPVVPIVGRCLLSG